MLATRPRASTVRIGRPPPVCALVAHAHKQTTVAAASEKVRSLRPIISTLVRSLSDGHRPSTPNLQYHSATIQRWCCAETLATFTSWGRYRPRAVPPRPDAD